MLNENIPMYLFHQGTNAKAYEYLGSHRDEEDENFTYFRVWAPHAVAVFVACDRNNWTGEGFELSRINEQGLWEGHFEGFKEFDAYKYLIIAQDGRKLMKCDPYAFHAETRPGTASKIYELGSFEWTDGAWMKKRRRKNIYASPMNIYELHVGSWQRYADGNTLSYRELADRLVPYVVDMGYTHVELLPIMEHPFDGSWGYQVTGYFAPTSRYGTPDDFMYFVNKCHENGIGVILDWVPAHFPKDEFGLYEFDGEACYEYADPNKGEHKQWGTRVFDYGRTEVQSFLMSSALFWLEVYHVDGLRVDAVASMLYLDYGRKDGEWVPNRYGGNQNLEAIELIKHLNSILKKRDPGVLSIAEESTAFPLITGSLEEGGLGFDLKWNMGFMNDYLDYIKYDPYFRSHHHGELTFSMIYAYSEKFMLVFSHDEVVHGKGTLLGKMPGDRAQKLANLRLTYGYMMTHPGKKLLFMGQDLAEEKEWNEMRQVEWQLEEQKENAGVQKLVKDLNVLYRENKALYECDDQAKGFQWMNEISANECYVSFVRKGEEAEELLLVVANFSGVPREITTGVPYEGKYKEILNTDAVCYGGTGVVNDRVKRAEDLEWDDKKQSVTVKLAPLSLSILQFIPYTEAELEKVIEKRIRKNTPIRKTTNKTAKKKQEK